MMQMDITESEDVEEQNVRNPLAFPKPNVVKAKLRTLQIHMGDKVTESMVLHTFVENDGILATKNYYEFGRLLKEAIFGQVNHAILLVQRSDGSLIRTSPVIQLAIKIYSKSRLTQYRGKTAENPATEIAAMQYLGSHSNVIRQVDCAHDEHHVYSIMEFVDGGELYDLVEECGAMSEYKARIYFEQILDGLSHMHSKGVGHRDLTLENVMYSKSEENCKIIDFGMCLLIPRDDNGKAYLIPKQGICGKRNYISPEVISNILPFNPMLSDIWGLGIILFILLTGVPLVDVASTIDQRYRMVSDGKLSLMVEQWGIQLSPNVLDLLTKILQSDPNQRLSLLDIKLHPWTRNLLSHK